MSWESGQNYHIYTHLKVQALSSILSVNLGQDVTNAFSSCSVVGSVVCKCLISVRVKMWSAWIASWFGKYNIISYIIFTSAIVNKAMFNV